MTPLTFLFVLCVCGFLREKKIGNVNGLFFQTPQSISKLDWKIWYMRISQDTKIEKFMSESVSVSVVSFIYIVENEIKNFPNDSPLMVVMVTHGSFREVFFCIWKSFLGFALVYMNSVYIHKMTISFSSVLGT